MSVYWVPKTTVVPKEVNKNGLFWRFFVNIFLLVCRIVRMLLLTQRTRLGGPFRYLEHVRQAIENFLEAFEKKFQPKKMGFCQNIPTRF